MESTENVPAADTKSAPENTLGGDMAGQPGESPDKALERCEVCGEEFTAVTPWQAQDAVEAHLREHGTRKISTAATMGRPSRKVIRWTITGEGGPLARAMTWSKVLDLVERAEKLGLRVEVAEVEEETR